MAGLNVTLSIILHYSRLKLFYVNKDLIQQRVDLVTVSRHDVRPAAVSVPLHTPPSPCNIRGRSQMRVH